MSKAAAVRRLVLWSLVVAVIAATRLPAGELVMTVLVASGALVLVALAAFTLWPGAPERTRPMLFVLSLVVFLMPPVPGAWLAGTPAWLVALLYVLALSVFFQDPGTKAPVLGEQARSKAALRRKALRFVPAASVALVLIALPLAYGFLLPQRMHAAFELQSAFAPLFVVLVLGTLLAAMGVLRNHVDALLQGGHAHERQKPVKSDKKAKQAGKGPESLSAREVESV